MKKNIAFGFFLIVFYVSMAGPIWAQKKLEISGRLRLLKPETIRLETITGEVLASCDIENNQPFALVVKKLESDVYNLFIGKTRQSLYLTGGKVMVKGFYNYLSIKNSSLSFIGIDAHRELIKWLPKQGSAYEKSVTASIQGKLQGNMYSALAYLADMTRYEPNKLLLDCMSEEALETASGVWLQQRSDSLFQYTLGVDAYDFSLKDENGNIVCLSDLRGKFVLVDFWASWCGPCRDELKKLLLIYDELKGDDLEFVSISLDVKEEHWKRALREEKIPWITLLDNEGFIVGNEPNTLQRAYGFYSIPFVVLIDKNGKVIGRDLRGEQVRKVIQEARKNEIMGCYI